jgi:hypothetical protein
VAAWRQVFRSLWKDFETRFNDILRSLSGSRQLIIEQASLVHYQQYQQDRETLRGYITRYEHDREEKKLQVKKQERAEMDKKYRDVLAWFSATQSTVPDHHRFGDTRNQYPGTGQWILKDEKIRKRMEDMPDSSIMWMNGKPGAGIIYNVLRLLVVITDFT